MDKATEQMKNILAYHRYHRPVFIGEGSFSEVYRVTDDAGRFWACKRSKAAEQWEKECENWQQIQHPLFPAYREHWTEGEYGYLIIEFWEGMDLREMLEKRGRLTPRCAAEITEGLAEGLQYLHERPHPFLYRDLKPENIRIRTDGSVGILDLGCLWNREQCWSGAGNYSYSAPEQFQPGAIPGEESDVYAVGKILAAMLGERKGRCGRREKWLRNLTDMAACENRRERIPDMKTFRRLLAATDASRKERKQILQYSDFYYIRKLYYP